MARMDQRFGGPLPHQLPNPPPTHPMFKERTFQCRSPIRYYTQFPELIPDHRAGYRRVTEHVAGIAT